MPLNIHIFILRLSLNCPDAREEMRRQRAIWKKQFDAQRDDAERVILELREEVRMARADTRSTHDSDVKGPGLNNRCTIHHNA